MCGECGCPNRYECGCELRRAEQMQPRPRPRPIPLVALSAEALTAEIEDWLAGPEGTAAQLKASYERHRRSS